MIKLRATHLAPWEGRGDLRKAVACAQPMRALYWRHPDPKSQPHGRAHGPMCSPGCTRTVAHAVQFRWGDAQHNRCRPYTNAPMRLCIRRDTGRPAWRSCAPACGYISNKQIRHCPHLGCDASEPERLMGALARNIGNCRPNCNVHGLSWRPGAKQHPRPQTTHANNQWL